MQHVNDMAPRYIKYFLIQQYLNILYCNEDGILWPCEMPLFADRNPNGSSANTVHTSRSACSVRYSARNTEYTLQPTPTVNEYNLHPTPNVSNLDVMPSVNGCIL